MTKKTDGQLVAEGLHRIADALELIGRAMIGEEAQEEPEPATYMDGTPIN